LRYIAESQNYHSEQAMLRLAMVLLAAVVMSRTAESADRAVHRHASYKAAINLPVGLPRPHYNFRTTISFGPSYPSRRPLPAAYEVPELLYAPAYVDVPYVTAWIGAPLHGYYDPIYTYDYQAPYYAAPYAPYWDRLPYACGFYGYC
jgi:hypothetical protein